MSEDSLGRVISGPACSISNNSGAIHRIEPLEHDAEVVAFNNVAMEVKPKSHRHWWNDQLAIQPNSVGAYRPPIIIDKNVVLK